MPNGLEKAASLTLREAMTDVETRKVTYLGAAPAGAQPGGSAPETPFWRRKKLSEMTGAEWESLCDGCGRCCLSKLEEEDTGAIYFTDIGCRLLDGETCRCRDYPNRTALVDDCVRLTPEEVATITWLPPSCAYRLIKEGKELYWWHPLVSGDLETVHLAGVSIRGRLYATEDNVGDEDFETRIRQWPVRLPKRARG